MWCTAAAIFRAVTLDDNHSTIGVVSQVLDDATRKRTTANVVADDAVPVVAATKTGVYVRGSAARASQTQHQPMLWHACERETANA